MESEQQDNDQDGPGNRKTCENIRKRRCSSTPTSHETPQKKTTSTPLIADEGNAISLLINGNGISGSTYDVEDEFLLEEFCDEVLYEIFKFLDTWSLMALMNVCKRFQKFVMDKRLWENIDLSQKPLPLGILEDMLERSHDKTHSIKLMGPSPSEHIEGEIQHFNKTIRSSFTTRCTKLVTLELYGVTLNFKQICIKDFPKPLKRLVLNNCNVLVDGNKAIFTGIDTILINLEELAIENNSWFDPYYVMPISKLPTLRYLSLKGCRQMQEFIPYGSIAARHGFKRLEVLDLRDTPLNDSDLQCFNAVETLKEIYLQCPEEEEVEESNSETSPSGRSQGAAINNGNISVTNTTNQVETEKPTTSSVSTQANGSVLNTSNTDTSSERPSTSSYAIEKNDDSKKTDGTSKSDSSLTLNDVEPTSPSSSTSTSSTSSVNNGSSSSNVVPLVGTNTPPRSRFLPRPDHIIYLDVRNRTAPNAVHINIRERIRHLRQPGQQQQQLQGQNQQSPPSPAFEQMIRHNLFWDIINPLGRVVGGGGPVRLFGEENVGAEFGGALNANHFNLFPITSVRQSRGSISDRGVCCFGRTRQPVQQGVIWIRFNNRPSENSFERFSVRDYKFVTDVSLQHLVQCSPHLVFLDVSGTGVTLDGVQRFKDLKPECKVVAEHLLDTTAIKNSEVTVS